MDRHPTAQFPNAQQTLPFGHQGMLEHGSQGAGQNGREAGWGRWEGGRKSKGQVLKREFLDVGLSGLSLEDCSASQKQRLN